MEAVTRDRVPARVRTADSGGNKRRFNSWAWLVLPGMLFLIAFFVVPIAGMAVRSFTDPGPENYLIFVKSGLYARVLWTTIRTAFVVTLVCLLLGYPYAYVMLKVGPKLTAVLGVLVLLPFWSSILVRTYAWTVLLQDSGIINSALKSLGVISQPLQLMRNDLGVTIGMSHILLPYMVFPIYAVMTRISPDLVPAAQSLGAPPYRAFLRVFWPQSVPGVAAGVLLVFVLSLGFFITPALLGSPSNTMFSVLVVNEVSQMLQFGRGSALAVVLLLVTLVLLWFGRRFLPAGLLDQGNTE